MDIEIKIEFDEVEQALNKLHSSASSIDSSGLKSINAEENNVLDVTSKITNLNQSLQEVLTAYKDLLALNVGFTNRSIETMKEVDHQLSVSNK